MTEVQPNEPRTDGAREPYVGLRPFDASERDCLYGRDQDAQILTDKILAGKLTILYAQSGLGKSSLLRALVVPQLEENDAQVMYFDEWAHDDPTGAIRKRFADHAESLGVPDAARGSPTLVELSRLIATVDDRGIVMVLDQFEEFLVTHGQRLDPLRTELAAVVRDASLDVQVVLSLREEFLAALEPFRQVMLRLFQSTYRLEPLDDEGIRDAICRPPESFGVTVEPELTQRLIQDLRVQETDEEADGASVSVDLPMLQLVCSQLWKAPQRKETGNLTLELYEGLGGSQRILDDYVRGVMPRRAADRLFTARLMKLLAPPSGLKMSYSVGDLASTTELDEDRIAAELDRLSRARILRTRDYRAGERFELQHDAFIRVVTPWREAVIARARRRRWVTWIAVSAAVLLLAGWGVVAFLYEQEQDGLRLARAAAEREKAVAESNQLRADRDRQEAEDKLNRERAAAAEQARKKQEAWLTGGQLEELRDMEEQELNALAPSRFDSVASYTLWKTSGPRRLDELRATLETYESLQPYYYGLNITGWQTYPPPSEFAPLTITYSTSRDIDPSLFMVTWKLSIEPLAKNWGVPVPLHPQLRTVETSEEEKGKVTVKVPGVEAAVFDLPLHEARALMTADHSTLPAPTLEFFERFKDEWVLYPGETSVPWWIVPRWSLPVWHSAGQKLQSGSGTAAVLLLQKLLDKPEPLLTEAGVEFLLRRVARSYPQTVREARAARGARLKQDLAEIVDADMGIKALPDILDFIAEQPKATPEEIGRMVVGGGWRHRLGPAEPTVDRVLLPGKLSGQRKSPADAPTYEARQYEGIEQHLPTVEPKVRAYLGSALERLWSDGNNLHDEVSQELDRIRREFYRAYGVVLPGVRFRGSGLGRKLNQREARLEMLDDDSDSGLSLELEKGKELEAFIRSLHEAEVRWRGHWVDAEMASSIRGELPPNTRAWIEKTYSITDLKILLRGVVSPVPEQPGPARTELGKAGGEQPAGDTLRYHRWLLRSLVFWSQVEDPLDARAIVRRLRELQSTRQRPRDPAPEKRLLLKLERFFSYLAEDRIDLAERLLKRTLDSWDRQEAIDTFARAWPGWLVKTMGHDLKRVLAEGDEFLLSAYTRIDLEDLLSGLGGSGDSEHVASKYRAEIEVMRLVRYLLDPPTDPKALERLLHDTLRNHDALEEWHPEHANKVAHAYLKTYDPLKGDAELLKAAGALMKRAIAGLDDWESVEAFRALVAVAQASAAPNWAWELLEDLAVARPHKATPSLPAELAGWYCTDERPERLRKALAWALALEDLAKKAELTEKTRAGQIEFAHYVQSKAHVGLAYEGHEEHWKPAEALLRRLSGSEQEGVARAAHVDLVRLLRNQERFEAALEANDKVKARWPDESQIVHEGLLVRIGQDDAEAVLVSSRAAQAMAESAAKEGNTDLCESLLYTTAIAALLVRPEGWEDTVDRFLEETKHHYRVYIRLMYLAFAKGEAAVRAKKGLEEHWKKIDASRWKDRMRAGDGRAWQEMLIGRVAAPDEEERAIPILEDEVAWRQSAFAGLPFSRRGQRCEFWFYEAMRRKILGDPAGMRDCLQRCVGVGYTLYWEYNMARFLLSEKR